MKPDVRVIYTGAGCRLGRFGRVEYGDQLKMTTREFATATEDEENAKRFTRINKDAKVPEKILKEADRQRKERVAAAAAAQEAEGVAAAEAAEKAEVQEKNRTGSIEKENDAEKNRNLELQQMTKEDLREYAAKLKNQGATIHVKTGASKRELIAAILQATDDGN